MDFLEHLPDEPAAVGVMRELGRAARDFVFIRHPSFEDVDYLARFGLKITWTDWQEHPNMMTLADYERVFAELGWNDYVINLGPPIVDSWHYAVLPIDAPRDAQRYDPEMHGPKPFIEFDRPLYEQFDIFVRLDPAMDDDLRRKTSASITTFGAVDGGDTVGVYEPATALWYLRNPAAAGPAHSMFSYGPARAGWVPLMGDWDGDGEDSPGAYDPSTGTFFLRNSRSDGPADVMFTFGAPGALPVAGDWDGDGVDSVGLYYPESGFWSLKNRNEVGPSELEFSFGTPGVPMLPVAGDWHGEGRDSVALYDPKVASWHVLAAPETGAAVTHFTFGPPNALPVAGDWDRDGADTVGAYVPAQGRWLLSFENATDSPNFSFTFGPTDCVPVAGRWRGESGTS
jgi:hypothetical protein